MKTRFLDLSDQTPKGQALLARPELNPKTLQLRNQVTLSRAVP